MPKRLTFFHVILPLLEEDNLDVEKAKRWFDANPFTLDVYGEKYDDETINYFYEKIVNLNENSSLVDSRIKSILPKDKELALKLKDLRDFWFKKTVDGMVKYCIESEEVWICQLKGDKVYRLSWFHYIICQVLNMSFYRWLRNESGETLTLSVPPQHLKSTLVSGAIPALMLGNRPNARVIIGGYNETFAKQLLQKDMMNLVDTKGYTKLFGKVFNANLSIQDKQKLRDNGNKLPIDTADFKGTLHNGGVFAGGLGQLTGKPAQFLIIDDPIPSAAVARSATEVAKVVNEFDSSASSRMRDKTFMAIAQTRWCRRDPLGVIIDREEQLQEMGETLGLKNIVLRAEYDPTDGFDYDFRTFKGEYLWEKISRKAYLNAKLSDTMTYHALYNQNPIDDILGLVKKEWINRYAPEDIPKEFAKIIISVDTSYNDTKTSDKCAIGVFGLTKNFECYLLDLVYDRLSFNDTKIRISNLIEKYINYSALIIELKANGQAVLDDIRRSFPRVIPYTPTESKRARVALISPILQGKGLYLPKNNIGDEMYAQLIAFRGEGKKEKDDLVDILTQCLIYCDKYFRDGLALSSIKTITNNSLYGSSEYAIENINKKLTNNFNQIVDLTSNDKGVWNLL